MKSVERPPRYFMYYMYIYIYHVYSVVLVLPVIKDCVNIVNHLQISLLFMNNFNPEQKASRPLGLHV